MRLEERARCEGIAALDDVDLITLLLPPGPPAAMSTLARRQDRMPAAGLLDLVGGLAGLARMGVWAQRGGAGLDDVTLARIDAALEIGRRVSREGALVRAIRLATPEHVAHWARTTLRALAHEEIWLLALDARHGLLGVRRAAQGGDMGCSTSARDLLRIALQLGAASFLLVHNHPSGDPSPSVEDARMTVEVARAASLVGLPLLDHVIVGGDSHVSLHELGLLDGVPGIPSPVSSGPRSSFASLSSFRRARSSGSSGSSASSGSSDLVGSSSSSSGPASSPSLSSAVGRRRS